MTLAPARARHPLRQHDGIPGADLADDVDVCDGPPHLAEVRIDVEGVGGANARTTIVGCD